MTTSSQLSTSEPETTKTKMNSAKTSTGTDSQKQRSYGGLSAGSGKTENGAKGTGIRRID